VNSPDFHRHADLAAVLARSDIWRGALAKTTAPTLPSGHAALDAELPGGGWPRGQLTELLCAHTGVGEIALLLPLLVRLSGEGGRIVLVEPPQSERSLHAPAWTAAGVRADRLVVLRPASPADALWAAVESLRCPGVALTLAWPDAAAITSGRRRGALAGNSLRRLQTAVAEGGGCGFLLRPAACAAEASPAPLRLRLAPARRGLVIDLLKRRGPPATQPLWLAIPRPLAPAPAHHDHGMDRARAAVPLVRAIAAA